MTEYKSIIKTKVYELMKVHDIQIAEEQINEAIDILQKKGVTLEDAYLLVEKKIIEYKQKYERQKKGEKAEQYKKKQFSKYAQILLDRSLTKIEVIDMIRDFNLDELEKKEILSKIESAKNDVESNDLMDSIQEIINKNMVFAQGYVFCIEKGVERLTPFVSYNIKDKSRMQIHMGAYDFLAYLKQNIKEIKKQYGNAEKPLEAFYTHQLQRSLTQAALIFENNPGLQIISAISFQVSEHSQSFVNSNMHISNVSEEVAKKHFGSKWESVKEAYLSREELLELYLPKKTDTQIPAR